MNCKIESKEILKTINLLEKMPKLNKNNIYGKGNTAVSIIKILKKHYNKK